MLLSFFRKSQISAITAVIIILIAIWLKTFINGVAYSFIFDSISMPLYSLAAKVIGHEALYSNILTILLTLSIAFYLLHLNGKFIIIKQRTYLPALFLVVISSALIPVQRINPSVFAALFITIALDHIFAIYQKQRPFDNLFRAGVSLGIATLFYAPAIPMCLIIFISLIVLRSFSLREWFISIIGIGLPWGFLLLINYWLNIDFSNTVATVASNLSTHTESSVDELIPIFFAAAIGIPTLVSLVYMVPSMANQKISVRKYQNIFLWLLLLCILTFAFLPTCSYEIIYIGAIPLSFQLGNYFTMVKVKFWPEVLFFLIFIAALMVQLYPFIATII